MSVTEIRPGVVKVEPDQLDENDVIELGEALIEEHGWVKNTGGDEKQGFSIHGAIGEAAKRATGEHEKDGPRSRTLRNAAAAKIGDLGKNEIQANDDATDVAEVLGIMREARGAV